MKKEIKLSQEEILEIYNALNREAQFHEDGSEYRLKIVDAMKVMRDALDRGKEVTFNIGTIQ
tara:strand:+ start:165 stop:350 length:186 start_codon:yes stop_codon:yes gene_type:complete